MSRRRWPALAAGLLALAAILALRALDPAPVEALRLRVFDLYQQLAPRPVPGGLPVRVVAVDEAALQVQGQWPWPRPAIATLVDRLTALGAAAICFDVLFAEPDRTSPLQLLRARAASPEAAALADRLQPSPDHDRLLAASFAASRVVGAVALLRDGPNGPKRAGPPLARPSFAYGGSDPARFVEAYGTAVRGLPVLEAASAGLGSITFAPDLDGVVRRVPLLQAVDGQLVPGLSAECLRVAQGADSILVRAADASGQRSFGAADGVTAVKLGGFVAPVTRKGELWIWYGDRPGRSFSAAQLFGAGWPELRERVEGQIMVVGATAQGLRDQRATPVSGALPGVEIHAQAIEQMLAGQFLRRPDWAAGAEQVALLAAGLLLVLVLPVFGPLPSAGIGAAAAGAGVAGSWLAYQRFGLLFDPVYPLVGVALVYLTVTTARFVLSERERGQVRAAFSRYLAPALVERLAERPQALRLGGESRELSVLFADIRGFTALAERLSPEALTASLNRFLTPMTDALLAEGATIDKYMGDAVMAFWNAPLDQPDHARRALRAALAMRRRLEELAPRWAEQDREAGREPVAIRFGLGLDSGACVVGNLGSEQRFDYSAVGDPVNRAARLESLSKVYGVDVLVGESTAALAPDFALVELDRVQVLGRERPLAVFALLGDEAQAADPAFQALRTRHAEALEAWRRGEWERAEQAFLGLLASGDPLLAPACRAFLARLPGCREAAPSGWDGVFRPDRK